MALTLHKLAKNIPTKANFLKKKTKQDAQDFVDFFVARLPYKNKGMIIILVYPGNAALRTDNHIYTQPY